MSTTPQPTPPNPSLPMPSPSDFGEILIEQPAGVGARGIQTSEFYVVIASIVASLVAPKLGVSPGSIEQIFWLAIAYIGGRSIVKARPLAK